MSIVERAIRKLQARGSTSDPVAADSGRAVPARQRSEVPEPALAVVAEQVLPTYQRRIKLDRAALRGMGMLPPEHQERLIANQYRQIKRPLIGALGDALDNRLIMVASALSGEGKTFTAFNLALSLAAEKDFSVLLVDTDIPKPHISEIFGLRGERGLMDVLLDGSLDVSSLIVGTDNERLAILPAGTSTESAPELLSSARMKALATSLTHGGKQIVVFDSSPLLLTNESRVLSLLVGQVVLVVRAELTPQQTVLDAVGLLNGAKNVSLILNQSEEEGESSYYYGYAASDAPPRSELDP
jgi:receptor protein-tyrosine kinase